MHDVHSRVHPGAFATATANAGGRLSIIKYGGCWTILATSGKWCTPDIGCGVANMARLGKQIGCNDRLILAKR